MAERSLSADTIVALATPLVRSAIAIVRISGSSSASILSGLCGTLPAPRMAEVRMLQGRAGKLDQALVLFFPAPHSFTGENVVELHVHGNPVLAQQVVAECRFLGARQAEPGEFTERAVRNGKLTLQQGEALGALIDASSLEAIVQTLPSLTEQNAFWPGIEQDLVAALAQIEAWTDFSEEEIEPDSVEAVRLRIENLVTRLRQEAEAFASQRGFRDGVKVVLAGPPNAGKSSLFNYLCGRDRAMVSSVAGTTRDTIDIELDWEGLPVYLVDTAGLRTTLEDPLEAMGMQRSRAAMTQADVILWLDCDQDTILGVHKLTGGSGDMNGYETASLTELQDGNSHLLVLRGRSFGDLVPESARDHDYDFVVSLPDGGGVETIQHRVAEHFRMRMQTSSLVSRRQYEIIVGMVETLQGIADHLEFSPELAAEGLYEARQLAGSLLGTLDRDAILDSIFSTFCIGK